MDGSCYLAFSSTDAVAPLRIEKKSPNVDSQTTSRYPKPQHQDHNHNHHNHFTPPTTPETCNDNDHAPEFHPFLRAFYPFHPTITANSTTVTLPLNSGDLILVHSVHTNGWADGTMLSSGARGWLPTNYCETYDTTHIRLLLKACLNLFGQFRAGSCGGLRYNQIAVTAVVAGVRHLLVCGSLGRFESPHPNMLNNPLGIHRLLDARGTKRPIQRFGTKGSKDSACGAVGARKGRQEATAQRN